MPLVITLQSAPPLDEGHQRIRVMMKACRIETGCTIGLNAFCGSDTRGHFDYDPPRSSGIVKWNQMFCVIAVYILLSCRGSGSKIDPTCTPCIHVTRSGQGVTSCFTILLCQGEVKETCIHNKTTYSICQQEGQYICFDPWLLLVKIS